MMIERGNRLRDFTKIIEFGTATVTDHDIRHPASEQPVHQNQKGQAQSVCYRNQQSTQENNAAPNYLIEPFPPVELFAIAERTISEGPG